MSSTASFIVIFSVWIAGIVVVFYLFLPSITASISSIESYNNTSSSVELRKQTGLSNDTSYTSLTPLGIFDLLKGN